MPKHLIDAEYGRPLLDIASYARRGPGQRTHLSREEIDLIRRTVTRTPEVVVKVLTRGGQNLKAVRAHFEYLNRRGDLEIETDHGGRLAGDGVAARLVTDWDLDVEEFRRRAELRPKKDHAPPKLVHKILFSMPPGTPSKEVLAAAKNFAREEFGRKHRYAMVLHSDEPHPHVHMVVKAVSERGERLNIRKATLRRWRADFAAQLRALGIAANATERAVRGSNNLHKKDQIFRAGQRGESVHWRQRAEEVEAELRNGSLRVEGGKMRMLETRRNVSWGWQTVANTLASQGDIRLAGAVQTFADRIPRALTEKEIIAAQVRLARDAAIDRSR